MNKRLFLDFDGTIVYSIGGVCDVYNKWFKDENGFIPAEPEKVRKYDFLDQCPLLQKGQVLDIFAHDDFFEKLRFMPFAQGVVEQLSRKYELYICSIGTLGNISKKADWIKKNMPYVKNTILMNISSKTFDKSIIDMNDSIFIDAHQDNLFSSNAQTKICYGKEYVWNKDWNGARATNWLRVTDLLLREREIDFSRIG